MENLEKIEACSLCGKPLKDIQVLANVRMDVQCLYVREDESLEDMNGLVKITTESFCETCFSSFVDQIEILVKKRVSITSQEPVSTSNV